MDDSTAPRAADSRTHRHARQDRHPVRLVLCLGSGLFGAGGTGWWLAHGEGDGSALGRLPVHVPRSLAVGAVMGLAGWGALLLLGEVLLFVLAVARVDDPEVYDRYRNLIVLWGYVLTLGTSRFFRRLPEQFAQLFGDDDDAGRHGRHRVNEGGKAGRGPTAGG